MLARLPAVVALASAVTAANVRSQTPPLGWNSYNYYSCSPSEDIMKTNAQGLVDLGLADVGYTLVTTDCGWPAEERAENGSLQWNAALFPSGGAALGEFLHGLGLEFGLYSGAGYFQCGSTNLPASLGHEELDAETFASWGGDSLKYDNCYSTSPETQTDYTGKISTSPTRFRKMAAALAAVERDMEYFVCQWDVGLDVGKWASAIANTWRISNDITDAWRSIWRITNQVVPFYEYTKPGAFPDMDMLIVGLNALSAEEERFHFGMWALNKSPLIIGAPTSAIEASQETLDTLSNKDVIAIDQDALGEQARLIRRYTEAQWDLWAGNLSDSRVVLGIANWNNDSQTMEFDLSAAGVASADARDVWASKDLGPISGKQSFELAGHELKLLILSNVIASDALQATGYYSAANATLAGSAAGKQCESDACLPTANKVENIGAGASVSFSSVIALANGTIVMGIDFINYDIALETAFGWGSNTRNMTIAVNGGTAVRWAFPISGGDWYETGRLMIEVDGFEEGNENEVVFGLSDGDVWAPDLVGFEMFG